MLIYRQDAWQITELLPDMWQYDIMDQSQSLWRLEGR